MKIQLKSDLHVEFNRTHNDRQKHYINPEADVIVLAGDIAVRNSELQAIVDIYGKCGKPVIYIAGNHEYYHNVFDTRGIEIQNMLEGLGLFPPLIGNEDITFLNPGTFTFRDTVFIGATLWTDLSNPGEAIKASMGMSDFQQGIVNGCAPYKWTDRHKAERKFIEDELQNPKFKDMKKVVITHFLPLPESVHPFYKDHSLNFCYVAHMEEFFHGEWSPDLWLHGHTHDSCDYIEGKTRVVCNPYGYDHQSDANDHGVNEEYKHDLIIEI